MAEHGAVRVADRRLEGRDGRGHGVLTGWGDVDLGADLQRSVGREAVAAGERELAAVEDDKPLPDQPDRGGRGLLVAGRPPGTLGAVLRGRRTRAQGSEDGSGRRDGGETASVE